MDVNLWMKSLFFSQEISETNLQYLGTVHQSIHHNQIRCMVT